MKDKEKRKVAEAGGRRGNGAEQLVFGMKSWVEGQKD